MGVQVGASSVAIYLLGWVGVRCWGLELYSRIFCSYSVPMLALIYCAILLFYPD